MTGSSGYKGDPRVDEYIERLPDWQQRTCQRLRELIHDADPDVTETIKRTVQPYFVLQGNICALLAAKDHINLFLYDGGIVPDPEGIITAGHDQQDSENDCVPRRRPDQPRALTEMLKQIIANNRVGGWRKLKTPRLNTRGVDGTRDSPLSYDELPPALRWARATQSDPPERLQCAAAHPRIARDTRGSDRLRRKRVPLPPARTRVRAGGGGGPATRVLLPPTPES